MKIIVQLTTEEFFALMSAAEFSAAKPAEKQPHNEGDFSLNPAHWGGK